MSDIVWPRVATFLLTVVVVALATGAMKAAGWLPCDISRKTNHVFALVGGALWFGWLPHPEARASAFTTFGLLIPMVAVICVLRDRTPFRFAFLANTRKSDAPHEAFYFWSSWLVSIAGLACIELAFDDMVITRTAGLIVGIGDGVAEPVGRRWGQHRYRVPSLMGGTPATRSLEGSAAVFVGCLLTLLACFGVAALPLAVTLAIILTLIEAMSPHGLDNFTLPVATAFLLRPLLVAGW